MKLDEKKMGEIALRALTQQMADNMPKAEALKRDLPNEVKKLGISLEEGKAFLQQILPKAVALRLGCSEVELKWQS
jgi:hypothetical protein